jgi:poly(3-hydroxybutyrate) depolymerase
MTRIFSLGCAALLICCGGADDAGRTPDAPAIPGENDASAPVASNDAAAPPPVSTLPTRSAGCGLPAHASPDDGDTKTVKVAGTDRSFVLYVPQGYDPSRNYPVVFALHGIGATGADMAAFIQMQSYSGGDAIVAFPSAANGLWDASGDADLRFFDAMLSSLTSTLCVNEQRVFALGFSYGAYMVNHLGCNRSATVRAIVAADGGFPGSAAGCGKTAALVYHRTEDDDEVIENGRKAREIWRGIDGCATTSKPLTAYGFNGMGCVTYDGCGDATPLVWCEDTASSPYKHDLRDVYRVPMWNWFNHF